MTMMMLMHDDIGVRGGVISRQEEEGRGAAVGGEGHQSLSRVERTMMSNPPMLVHRRAGWRGRNGGSYVTLLKS